MRIFTSEISAELDMPNLEIIDKYHGLTRIEDQFREMKSTLEARSVYVHTPEHIQAHLMICFMALTMTWVTQRKIMPVLPSSDNTDLNWSYALPGDRLAKALNGWQVDRLPRDYYRILNSCPDDLALILRAFGSSIPYKLFTRGDRRSLKASATVF